MAEGNLLLLRPESAFLPPTEVTVEGQFPHEVQLLENFANKVTFSGRSLAHPIRTAAIASDFSNGRLNNEFYATALLHDVFQAALPETSVNPAVDTRLYTKNAARLLQEYSATDYAKEWLPEAGMSRWDYIVSISAHLNTVEEYAERNRQVPANKSERLKEILQGHSIGNVDTPLWLEPIALTEPVTMEELLGDGENGQEAELEAVIIKAAEKLDSLFYPPDNEQSLLRNLHDAESFYAPICEIIGQDGLASALRNQASIIRLQKSGHGAFVEKAQEIIASLGEKEEVLHSVENLLGKLAVGEVEVDRAFRDTTGHGITLGTAEIEIHGGEHGNSAREARAIWRIKSVGSLAMKLLGDNKHLKGKSYKEQKQGLQNAVLPADILGITIVAPNQNDLGRIYAKAAVDAYDDEELRLIGTANKSEPYYIKGSEAFVRNMVGAIALEETNKNPDGSVKVTRDAINIPEEEGKMEVAKFTIEYDGKPTEVQFVTTEMRLQTRVGLAAHILYKLKEQLIQCGELPENAEIPTVTEKEIAAMEAVHDRAIFLGSYTLMNMNHPRKRALALRIAQVSARWYNWRHWSYLD
ncbi:hypothetical protein KDA14_02785 [Candidatus Saccharibacteria bacterium]|nr:hypothetical protein [Candidatus Saccharibacteria bacterium]